MSCSKEAVKASSLLHSLKLISSIPMSEVKVTYSTQKSSYLHISLLKLALLSILPLEQGVIWKNDRKKHLVNT